MNIFRNSLNHEIEFHFYSIRNLFFSLYVSLVVKIKFTFGGNNKNLYDINPLKNI